MTPQDYDDLTILKHAAKDILREVSQLLDDPPPNELDGDEIIEKGAYIRRIGEIISEILISGKHLPYGEDEE